MKGKLKQDHTKKTTDARALLQMLKEFNAKRAGGMTVQDLVEISGRDVQAVRRFLLEARTQGRVVCLTPKWYERADGHDGRTRLYWRTPAPPFERG